MSSATITSSPTLLPPECYGVANLVNLVIQSIGLVATQLCPADGAFSTGLLSLSACLSSHTESGDRSVATLIETAIGFCDAQSNTLSSRSDTFTSLSFNATAFAITLTSVCCGIDEGAKAVLSCDDHITSSQQQSASFTSELYSQGSSMKTAATPGQTTQMSSSPTQSLFASQTPATTSNSNSNTPNVGLIVGAAVGATVAFFLLIAAAGLFVWRRRKQQKARRLQEAAVRSAEPEKAQSHSEDLKPRREELPGESVVLVKSVGGLQEMDGMQDVRSHVRELPANEDIGSELTTEASKGDTTSTART